MNEQKKIKPFFGLSLPYRETLLKAIEHLSFGERVIFYALTSILLVSASVLVFRVNDLLLVEVPTHGGEMSEGILGSPRFINPLLAISDADRDLTSIIYSGLLRATPEGLLIPDLAESYKISEDGLTYAFTLRKNLSFHDGTPITADDVEFTILKAQDATIKSPKRANWDSVSVEKINELEIHFTLKQPYSPFLENTTLGIIPKHLWKDLTPEEFTLSFFNVEPIGSGPFLVKRISRNSSGIPQEYILSSFKSYALGEPYINQLSIVFYTNENSLIEVFINGEVKSINSITPEKITKIDLKKELILTTPLSRIFGIFFNQNQSALFADKNVREALNISLDKDRIVKEVLSGFGVTLNGPVPPGFLKENTEQKEIPPTTQEDRILKAQNILESNGWKKNSSGIYEKTDSKKVTSTLSFSLSTPNAEELKKTAEIIKQTWQSVGANVDIKIFEQGDLSQNVIRPRKYDALLFGEIIGRDLDLFAFWHSSQRNDPGLNIALYTNTKTDSLLNEARTLSSREDRLLKYEQFEEEVIKDTPAIFLYSPTFIYVVPKQLQGLNLAQITVPSERFLEVNDWYIETQKIWKLFINKRINRS